MRDGPGGMVQQEGACCRWLAEEPAKRWKERINSPKLSPGLHICAVACSLSPNTYIIYSLVIQVRKFGEVGPSVR